MEQTQTLPGRRGRVFLAVGLALLVSGVGWLGWRANWEPHEPLPTEDIALDPPLVTTPPAVPVASATVPDDAVVVGVSVGETHRAYVLSALDRVDWHVINDEVGGVPVTVTYCNLKGCVRTFTSQRRKKALDVRVAGWVAGSGGSLVLRVDRVRYRQDTTEPLPGEPSVPFPYEPGEHVRTTWKRWREAHPTTDVFVGG